MLEIGATSGFEAQTKLAEIVRDSKQLDPFKHITLVVESNHQALQFRRQLVRSLARIGAPSALVAFSAHTKLDLLAILAGAAQVKWNYDAFDKVRQTTLREVLVSRDETFANLANHAESFETILNYTRQFDWQVLTPELLVQLGAASQSSITKISLGLLEVALTLQEKIRESGIKAPADVASEIEQSLTADQRKKLESILGFVVSLAQDYPHSLENLVSNLVSQDSHARLHLSVGEARSQPTQIISYPDPETEAKAVVREVAKKISQGFGVDQFAVLYTDATQYSEILAHEFEEAGISWNGISTESPAITRAGVATKSYFGIAQAILATSTFTKSDLQTIFRMASVHVLGEEVRTGALGRFIQKNGLFNEVNNWIPQLRATGSQLAGLKAELQDLITWNADQEEIDQKNSEIKNSEQAATLIRMVDSFIASAERLVLSKNNQELATQIWIEINEFFPHISDSKMPVERLAFEKLAELFSSQHSSPISTRQDTQKSLQAQYQSIFLRLTKMKLQHGELARGVYVGPVSQNGALYFENLWVVGAGDGMLPQAISEDPIFPDTVKSALGKLSSSKFPGVSGRVREIQSNYLAVTKGAKNLTISYPRGGTLAKSEGKPSPWLDKTIVAAEIEVQAAKEFRLQSLNAISKSDLSAKQSAEASAQGAALGKALRAAIWFAAPESSEFLGDLSGTTTTPLIDFESMALSASSAEKFLKCNHNFFTTKLLGVSDNQDEDSIEEVRAIDFGKAVHKAFERLLLEAPQFTPTFGKEYSAEAKNKFVEIFEEECDLLFGRGQAGWGPLFESRKRSFIDLIDFYFDLESMSRTKTIFPKMGSRGSDLHEVMSESDFLRPHLSEFEFHKQGDGLLLVSVTAKNYPEQILRFTGSIDRVDISENSEHVGVVDFKTGKMGNIDENTAVQDLLYEKAIRHSTGFLGVKKVSSRYLFLSRRKEDSGLKDIRADRDRRVFLPESAGGLIGSDYSQAVMNNRSNSETELEDKLALLVTAAFEGRFLTHNVEDSKASFAFCPTCKKLGQRQISQLSRTLYPPKKQQASAEEEVQG